MTDEEIRAATIKFAKQNKNRIAKQLTDPTIYVPAAIPISVFMAGSPGAGKTVNKVSSETKDDVSIFLVKKDFEKNIVENLVEIPNGVQIDDYIGKNYTKDELENCL